MTKLGFVEKLKDDAELVTTTRKRSTRPAGASFSATATIKTMGRWGGFSGVLYIRQSRTPQAACATVVAAAGWSATDLKDHWTARVEAERKAVRHVVGREGPRAAHGSEAH